MRLKSSLAFGSALAMCSRSSSDMTLLILDLDFMTSLLTHSLLFFIKHRFDLDLFCLDPFEGLARGFLVVIWIDTVIDRFLTAA